MLEHKRGVLVEFEAHRRLEYRNISKGLRVIAVGDVGSLETRSCKPIKAPITQQIRRLYVGGHRAGLGILETIGLRPDSSLERWKHEEQRLRNYSADSGEAGV